MNLSPKCVDYIRNIKIALKSVLSFTVGGSATGLYNYLLQKKATEKLDMHEIIQVALFGGFVALVAHYVTPPQQSTPPTPPNKV